MLVLIMQVYLIIRRNVLRKILVKVRLLLL